MNTRFGSRFHSPSFRTRYADPRIGRISASRAERARRVAIVQGCGRVGVHASSGSLCSRSRRSPNSQSSACRGGGPWASRYPAAASEVRMRGSMASPLPRLMPRGLRPRYRRLASARHAPELFRWRASPRRPRDVRTLDQCPGRRWRYGAASRRRSAHLAMASRGAGFQVHGGEALKVSQRGGNPHRPSSTPRVSCRLSPLMAAPKRKSAWMPLARALIWSAKL